MPIPTVTKLRTGDLNIDRIGDALRDIEVWLGNREILDGRLITGQVLTLGASGTTIPHLLGRAYKGYIIVRNTSSTMTHCDQTTGIDTAKFINIRTTVTVTASIWVF